MKRYHVNSETGEAGECRAEHSCPFGDLLTDHYSSALAARAGFEAAMGSEALPDPVRAKRSVWDRLKGVRAEDSAARARAEAAARFTAELNAKISELSCEEPERHHPDPLHLPREAFLQLLVVAVDYDARKPEALELLAHFDALTAKQAKIEAAAEALVQENLYAFGSRAFAHMGGWLLRDKGARLLRPGPDANLYSHVRPHCERLIEAHVQAEVEREKVREEAKQLKNLIIEEAALDAGDRTRLSARTRDLMSEALDHRSSALPSPEELEDRRAWSAARQQALEELRSREA